MRCTLRNRQVIWLALVLTLAVPSIAGSINGVQAQPPTGAKGSSIGAKTGASACLSNPDSPACVQSRFEQVQVQINDLQLRLSRVESQPSGRPAAAAAQPIPPLKGDRKTDDPTLRALQDEIGELSDRVAKLIDRVNAIR